MEVASKTDLGSGHRCFPEVLDKGSIGKDGLMNITRGVCSSRQVPRKRSQF